MSFEKKCEICSQDFETRIRAQRFCGHKCRAVFYEGRKYNDGSRSAKEKLSLRFDVFNRDWFSCVYCGSEENLETDHVIPVCEGGPDEMENLVTACRKCNKGKAFKLLSEEKRSFILKRIGVIHD